MEELLEEFIDYLKDCGEDAFYVFDNTEEAIKNFIKQRENLKYVKLKTSSTTRNRK